jgi:hypothetical protein
MVDMQMQVEAVYENGVLRPLEPLALEEHQHVTFTLTVPRDADEWPPPLDGGYIEAFAAN